jgi:protein-disulfide isomerase
MKRPVPPKGVHAHHVVWVMIAAFASVMIASCQSNPPSYSFVSSRGSLPVHANGTTLGSLKAAVTIDEYSDFQCPFCKDFSDKVEPRILEEYVVEGRVRIIYHPFGNWVSRKADGNTESERTAEAAYFAADHDRFWQLHDRLFAAQDRPNSGVFSNEKIQDAAVQVGLDGRELLSDLAAGTYASRAQKDFNEGIARGVTSTPTFFVNGTMIVGARPYEEFKAAIDDALRADGESPAQNKP